MILSKERGGGRDSGLRRRMDKENWRRTVVKTVVEFIV